MSFSDWVGFIGVSILLVAFLLNLLKRISQDSVIYLSLNLLGAAMACLASALIEYVPFILLEGTWTLVSAVSLIKTLIKKAA